MAKKWPIKDPDEVLDYTINWTRRLADGETITVSTWTITGDDSVLVEDSNSISSPSTVIWLSGGTLNEQYTLTNHVTTSSSREMDQTVTLKIKSK